MHSEDLFRQIKNATNAIGESHFILDRAEEVKVNILVDKKIKTGLFIPSKIALNTYYAHPNTIKAMRKDLFVAGEDFSELEKIATCSECHQKCDLQFWLLCPHCLGNLLT